MEIDEKLLSDIINTHNSKSMEFVLHIEEKSFLLSKVKLSKFKTPLTKPNTRGGVYFSNPTIYKIKGGTSDMSLVPLLANSMLGPNTEFQELEIKIKFHQTVHDKEASIFVNLTNTMQATNRLELFMNIVGTNIN
jgi:hypothetical protein